jgi:SAM-dependent methyltransferase
MVTNLSDCTFYHTMDLPEYGTQLGAWDLRGRFFDYIGHVDCAGKRVLDIGCASGFLSFSAEAMRASEVVSFEMDHAGREHRLPFCTKDYYRDHPAWLKQRAVDIERKHKAYWLAHRALASNAKVYHGDVYDLPDELGMFDVVIVGAVLEHLSDPIRAMASIARRCSDFLVISTDLRETEDPIAHFMGRIDLPNNDHVFWVYSLGVYRHVLLMLGFNIIRTVTRDFRFNWRNGDFPRTAIVAQRFR